MIVSKITFPEFSGIRCLMMPYIQGDTLSVPKEYQAYADIIRSAYFSKGDIGFLTIDESVAKKGTPHRGERARYGRALHTEAGRLPHQKLYCWGSSGWGSPSPTGWGGTSWGGRYAVTLDADVEILLANNLDNSCALWDAAHEDTSLDGDIGYASDQYPYENAIMMQAGDVHRIGIFTPHESLPVKSDTNRQFLRIVSSGVHGQEPYFTPNPLLGRV